MGAGADQDTKAYLLLAVPPMIPGSCDTRLRFALMPASGRIGILSYAHRETSRRVAVDDLIDIEGTRVSEEIRVYAWRVEQLAKLGLPTMIADAVASFVDWHDVARLVQKGCPPELALEIAR
jgi:hypothetical protein